MSEACAADIHSSMSLLLAKIPQQHLMHAQNKMCVVVELLRRKSCNTQLHLFPECIVNYQLLAAVLLWHPGAACTLCCSSVTCSAYVWCQMQILTLQFLFLASISTLALSCVQWQGCCACDLPGFAACTCVHVLKTSSCSCRAKASTTC